MNDKLHKLLSHMHIKGYKIKKISDILIENGYDGLKANHLMNLYLHIKYNTVRSMK